MNDAERTLLTYVVNNDMKRARETAKYILTNNKTVKDADFCAKMAQKMDAQDKHGIGIPPNLNGIVQTSCTAYPFRPERYFRTKREDSVIEHIQKMYVVGEKLSERGIHYTNAVLLTGMSGTGKTTFAQYVAHKLDLPFFYVSVTQMLDSYMGKTGKNMDLVFSFAGQQPCVLVLDEIDQIGTKRGEDSGVSGELKRVLISVMQNLDKLPNGVVLIAATNRPEALDAALVRRFPIQHEVLPLDTDEACAFIQQYMADVGLAWEDAQDMIVPASLAFLTFKVQQRQAQELGCDAFTPSAITDCLNEAIASAMFNGDDKVRL